MEAVKINQPVEVESGNKVLDYLLAKGFPTGEEVDIPYRDRVEEILPGGPHRRLGNPTTRWKWAWRRVESIPMEVDTTRGEMDLEDRVGRVVSQMGLKKTRGPRWAETIR